MAKKRVKGVVVSNKMDKTVVVSVNTTLRHPRYDKVVKRKKRYYAHTEGSHQVGDEVTIEQSRPISKLKRWVCVSAKTA